MKEQMTAVLRVLTHPKQTMQGLPSDRLFLLAFASPIYFAVARAFRPRNHEVLLNAMGSWQVVLLVVVLFGLIMVPVWAWLFRQFLKLFKKRLSVRKLMNINGYAHVPRLVVAAVGYVFMFVSPGTFTSNSPSPGLMVLGALGLIGICWTLWLAIYGVVVSPSDAK